MKTFLIVIIILSMLIYANSIWSVRTPEAAQNKYKESLQKLQNVLEYKEENPKFISTVWVCITGLSLIIKIVVGIMIICAL